MQQQIASRESTGITYYRRINGGFTVTKNLAVAASDFTQFNLTAPTCPRLPSSGKTLTFYDVNPGITSQGVSSLTTVQPRLAATNRQM